MKNNKDLNAGAPALSPLAFWCVIAAICIVSFKALGQGQDVGAFYDSSIQRSNFLSTDPRYENIIEEQLQDRRSLFLWKLRFDSQNLQTANNIQSQNVGATIRGKFNYKLVDNLDFRATGNISLESGRSQSIFGDLEPASGLYPRELKLHWRVIQNMMDLDFGQIHQEWHNEPLFIGNLGFPGLSESFYWTPKNFEFIFNAQQLIPTSSTLSTRVTEREEMPTLTTETLQATVHLSRSNYVKGRVTHFRYNNLPHIVAFESFLYGNTVTNSDVNNARFIYGFEGFLTQLAFEQRITDSLSAQIQWNTIKNNKAPSSVGEAQSIRAWVANDFGRWILAGMYMNYFIESDAVPAFYNSYRYGHNNRIGNSFEINLESKNWGVIFKAHYTEADLLNESSRRIDGLQQDDQKTIYFAVETMYDFI